MTKDQKVESVSAIVKEVRRNFTQQEFVDMVARVWEGLEAAKVRAVENIQGGANDRIS